MGLEAGILSSLLAYFTPAYIEWTKAPLQTLPDVLTHTRVRAIDITSFHPSGHQRAVSVLNDLICTFQGFLRVFFVHFFQSPDRLVGRRSFCEVRHYMPILIADVIPHDHSDIIKFKALCCMDTAGFVYGSLSYSKGLPVVKVPADSKIPDPDIMIILSCIPLWNVW